MCPRHQSCVFSSYYLLALNPCQTPLLFRYLDTGPCPLSPSAQGAQQPRLVLWQGLFELPTLFLDYLDGAVW